MASLVGPRTKGLRLSSPRPLEELRADLREHPRPLDDDLFGLPLLTLDDAALAHNIGTMARACVEYDVLHAPHVKTPMSADIWARQEAAGAWAATVAMPHQLRAVRDWGARRVLLANELVDVRDARALAADLARDPGAEVWLEVDSTVGIEVLTAAFTDADDSARARLHPLVEVGVPGGRTGVRSPDAAVALARGLLEAGLGVAGVIGYEGPAAADATPADLAAVAAWLADLVRAAEAVARAAQAGPVPEPPTGREGLTGDGGTPAAFVLSVGGSAYLDVVLPALSRVRERGWTPVVRAGSYVAHDDGHYADVDPWARLPGGASLRSAATVLAPVLSVPEPGLALLGAGRRDLPFDAGLPRPLWWRRWTPGCVGSPATPFAAASRVTGLNDQHAFVSLDGADTGLHPGAVVGLGISHPCTVFDKWRLAALVRDDAVVDLYPLDF